MSVGPWLGRARWEIEEEEEEMMRKVSAARDVPRAVKCCCGWGGIYPTLKAANAAIDLHKEIASANQDHTVAIWDKDEVPHA